MNKRLPAIVGLLLLCLTAKAAPFWSSPTPNFQVFTNTPVLVSTNASPGTFTNNQEAFKSVYHTFQIFYTATGTNTSSLNIDKTIDGVNFIPYSTNSFTVSSNAEYTIIGKWTSFRLRASMLTTNGGLTVNYISQ